MIPTGLGRATDLERALATGPVKHRQRYGDRNVDTDLSGLGFDFKLAASGTVVGLRYVNSDFCLGMFGSLIPMNTHGAARHCDIECWTHKDGCSVSAERSAKILDCSTIRGDCVNAKRDAR